MNYQKVILVGNATVDAELKKGKEGAVSFAAFSIAVSEDKAHQVYFPVVVFGKYGASIAQYVRKGRQVLVEGRIAAGDGGRYKVVANQVRLGSRPEKRDKKADE